MADRFMGSLLRALYQAEPEGLDQNWVSCFGYRPTTAEGILQNWVQALPNLQWWSDCQLLQVERSGSSVQAVLIQRSDGVHRIACDVVIDGSDRGDLLPLVETPFRLGWEAQELWGEPSAPSAQRLKSEGFFREQPVQSPTWVVMGQLQSDRPLAAHASGVDPNGTPLLLPEPFKEACAAFGLERTISYGRLPGGLVMLNWPLHGNDWHRGLERAFHGIPRRSRNYWLRCKLTVSFLLMSFSAVVPVGYNAVMPSRGELEVQSPGWRRCPTGVRGAG
jgi:hypothetical protein